MENFTETCNFALIVPLQDKSYYTVQFVQSPNITSSNTLGIHMQLNSPDGLRRYAHLHMTDPSKQLCPEFFRVGHTSDNVLDLASLLNQPERHEIRFADYTSIDRITIKGEMNVYLSMSAFLPNPDYEAVSYLISRSTSSNQINVVRKSITHKLKIRPWEVHRMVTELVQAHPDYEEQMYQFQLQFHTSRNNLALVIVLARKGEYADRELTEVMHQWIIQGKRDAKFIWPGTQL
ncbi:unnamed protein product [Echinostoma caproni]|nr:unnamed protein product [Echinostoma caproni]